MAVKSLKTSGIIDQKKSNSMLSGYSFQDFELIDSVFLASAATSITFNNLNQYATQYKHLQIRFTARSTNTDTNWWSIMTEINGDTGSNYAFHRLVGNGSVVTSEGSSSTSLPRNSYLLTSFSTNGFNGGVMDILDPYSTVKNTVLRTFSGVTGPSRTFVELNSVFWNNPASMTSIKFFIQSGGANFQAGSRFSLYGIR